MASVPRQATVRVTLVRHAAPWVSGDAHPGAWPLSPAGRAAAHDLRLPAGTRAVTSDERKAVETLALALGVAGVPTDPRFGEVRRPPEPVAAGFREVRRAWVEGALDARHDGWEAPDAAARRFDDAVREHAAGRDLVVATHGMVLTAWLVGLGRVPAGPPAGAFWTGLGLPGVVPVVGGAGIRRRRRPR